MIPSASFWCLLVSFAMPWDDLGLFPAPFGMPLCSFGATWAAMGSFRNFFVKMDVNCEPMDPKRHACA